MFRFRDLENYYYFILKPNGYELGKKQGSDEQIFLVTGTSPQLALGKRTRIQIQAQGARIRVFVGGAKIIDFTGPTRCTAAPSYLRRGCPRALRVRDGRPALTLVSRSPMLCGGLVARSSSWRWQGGRRRDERVPG